MPGKENAVITNLGGKDKPYFLRAKVWGVSGNHEEIVLSEYDKSISNKTFDYIFYTSDVYYKVESDTITLYAPPSSISEPVKSFLNIIVNIKG